MSFNPLTEAECGQKNPLGRLTSHVTSDHAFSETRGQNFDQRPDDFNHEARVMPQTFKMDDLMREMQEIESQRRLVAPVPASAVKDQLQESLTKVDDWARQYLEDGKVFHDHSEEDVWNEVAQQQGTSSQNPMYRHILPRNLTGPYSRNVPPQGPLGLYPQILGPIHQPPVAIEMENQSKEEFKQIWTDISEQEEKAKLEAGTSATQRSAQELTHSVDDPKFVYSKFMKFMKQVGDGTVSLEDGRLTEQEAQSWSQEFLQNNPSKSDVETFAETLSKNYEDDFNSQFWSNLQEGFKRATAEAETDENWASDIDQLYNSPYNEYVFSEDNPMANLPNALERGKELLQEGDLPSAVLCFEAAVQQEPTNSEAWFLLGKTQAENEQDPNAIPALKKCLDLDPKNQAALMALAVSYTNESYYSQAAQMLLNWLANHPKYSDLVPPGFKLTGQVTSFLEPDQHKRIQDLFIKAALRQPDNIDYEVQCNLGVLFNLSGEYDKAADCFRAALSMKPEDAKLWNRLGATLANGSKSEEAVDAYHHALNLEPGFIRARYNVGIICINLRAYREAAEHFLTALNQQARGKDMRDSPSTTQMSNTIWSTLRMVISLLNRQDLKPLVDNKDLVSLNTEFNITGDS